MIHSEDIILRALEPDDVDLLYQWENDMNLWVVSNTLTPFSKYQLKEYIKNSKLDLYQTKQLRLIIDAQIDKKNHTIGMIDLFDFDAFHNRGGIGISIHSDHRKKGYAYKALDIFIQYCFEHLGIHQLYANISEDNHASIALFEKLKFKLSGRKLDWRKTTIGYSNELFYQRIK